MIKKVNTRSSNFGEKLRKLIPGEKSWPDLNLNYAGTQRAMGGGGEILKAGKRKWEKKNKPLETGLIKMGGGGGRERGKIWGGAES